ncbi:HNH endonuclease [Moritella sp. 36]|uniref:HNH endonuclease n=1 Tax=Moritella sp. 36 TaxID=2746233 RepID=UPI001BA49E45|nr:HNH endonuclease [Moritella sp. 36]QUM88844.1 HNH endonuclease [Moritella sp. 36]
MKYLESFKVGDAESWLDLALGCRKLNVKDLIAIENPLKSELENYDEIISNYDDEPSISEFDEHKDLLVSYYESAPTRLNRLLLSRRNDHGLLDCPFCGHPKEPDTLDHFIPKDDWPEFSINPNNLVPQCRGCAPTKGSSYYCDENESTLFLHPMYSNLLSKFRFKIIVNFTPATESVIFNLRLTKPKALSVAEVQKVILHFRSLKLNERIQIYSYREIKKWKSMLISRRFNIEDALTQRINERAVEDRYKDWKTALYSGIIDNRDFITYLNNLSPQNNVQQNDEVEDEIDF